jgi:hypothetical protein
VLGRAAAVAGRGSDAQDEFSEALRRDPDIDLDPAADPPYIVQMFKLARSHLPAATPVRARRPPAPQPALQSWLLAAPVPVLLAILLVPRLRRRARARRARPRPLPSGALDLAGNWSLTSTLVANSAGAPNGETRIEQVNVLLDGDRMIVLAADDSERFAARLDGSAVTFDGSIPDERDGRPCTRSYSGAGTASPTLILGALTVCYALPVQTRGFQFQSESKYDYNITMTRL